MSSIMQATIFKWFKRKRKWPLYCILVILCLNGGVFFAQEKQTAAKNTAISAASDKTPRLFLSRVKTTHNLDPYLEILLDTENNLTINDVISDKYAKKFATDQTSTGLSESMWVRFTLVNDLPNDEHPLMTRTCFILFES